MLRGVLRPDGGTDNTYGERGEYSRFALDTIDWNVWPKLRIDSEHIHDDQWTSENLYEISTEYGWYETLELNSS